MPLPKPQAALLFNNYFDEDSITKTIAEKVFQNQDSVPVEQPLDIELILAGAYYNFVNGKGEELGPKLDKKVPFSENSDFKTKYKNIFELPSVEGVIPVGIYNPNFVEITTDNINPADLFSEFEVTSGKTEGDKQVTTVYISSNLYAALDAFFSVGGEKLAVPFVAGEDVSAAAQQVIPGAGD
jgi:hypothetical protein